MAGCAGSPPAAGLPRAVDWPLVQIPADRHTATGTCVLGRTIICANRGLDASGFCLAERFRETRQPRDGRETWLGPARVGAWRSSGAKLSSLLEPSCSAPLFSACYDRFILLLSSCSDCKCDCCRSRRNPLAINDFRRSRRAEPGAALLFSGRKQEETGVAVVTHTPSAAFPYPGRPKRRYGAQAE